MSTENLLELVHNKCNCDVPGVQGSREESTENCPCGNLASGDYYSHAVSGISVF